MKTRIYSVSVPQIQEGATKQVLVEAASASQAERWAAEKVLGISATVAKPKDIAALMQNGAKVADAGISSGSQQGATK